MSNLEKARIKESAFPAGRVADYLSYDPESGLFLWKFRQGESRACKTFNATFGGRAAGSINVHSRRVICIEGKDFLASRLAVALMLRRWPLGLVDHENGVTYDDRWSNLREATFRGNNQNKPVQGRSISGVAGVTWRCDSGNWRAAIRVDGRNISLGSFPTIEEARAARYAAEDIHHGRFAGSRSRGLRSEGFTDAG